MLRRALQLLLALTALDLAEARRTEPSEYDWGFLASRHADLHGDVRTRVAGPLFESAGSTNGMELSAWRPLYSEVEDPAHARAASDYLWPIATARTLEEQSNWRALFFFGFNHNNKTNVPRERIWLFPFYFSGRDASGQTYRAVFPIGGSIHEFLGRDEISFVLFPIHSKSRIRSLHTSNWIWPICSVTRGDGVYRARVFPFYIRSIREGQYDKKAVLWPFWNQVRYDDPRSHGKGFILWPLFGRLNLSDQKVWWFLPPFFKFAHSEQMTQVNCPWPFYQYARSKDQEGAVNAFFTRARAADYEKRIIWPLWGHKRIGDLERSFLLWPLFWHQTVDRPDVSQERFQVVPFWMHQREVTPTNGVTVARYHKFWPLYSYRRVGEESRLRMLELWPFAEAAAVERNWAPLWTLWSRQRLAGRCDTEVLWGLYRDLNRGAESRYVSLFPLAEWTRREEGPSRSWSLLKGLVGRKRVGSHVQWRVLYFLRFGCVPEEVP